MKLLIITPTISAALSETASAALHERYTFQAQLTFRSLEHGPASIEGFADETLAGSEVLSLIAREEKNYDGFFINCCGDVAVDAARELTGKPVLGAGEASFFLAAMMGVPFSIITIGSNARNKMGYRYRELGCSRFASAVGIPEGVLSLNTVPEATAMHIWEAAEKERRERGAELIVLGCTGMIDVAALVAEKLDCPLIEPSAAGIKLLEAFVQLGITHPHGGKYNSGVSAEAFLR